MKITTRTLKKLIKERFDEHEESDEFLRTGNPKFARDPEKATQSQIIMNVLNAEGAIAMKAISKMLMDLHEELYKTNPNEAGYIVRKNAKMYGLG